VLTERISRGEQRVPVKKLHPEDLAEPALSGGYIVQVNDPDMPSDGFEAIGERFLFVHPKQDDVLPAQTQYIADYLESVMRAASAVDGIDPTTGKHYSDLIDVAAFVDHHILNVLVKNPDAFALSSYFYKDRAGRLAAGPLWDLDLGMGAEDPWGQRSIDPTQWSPAQENFFARSFWTPLFSQAEFVQAYWARWRELLAEPFAAAQLQSLVDELERQVTLAEPRNRARWPASAPRNDSLADEADALRAWLAARVAWISANVGTLPEH
jgi:spore coat protein CotH